eukprot:GFKZ01008145.1.p1 GENE.GFKZ01008145.1~~GFKZ01008145.1.p1  ORF type:complete len:514 (+),score=95.12 GFKZ01008145.1:105-1544(+)
MSSTLETLRQAHEDVEILCHLASCALQSRTSAPTTHTRLSSHTIPTPRVAEQLASDLIQLAHQKSRTLQQSYESPDVLRQITIGLDDQDPMSLFYAKLRDLREAHRSIHSGRLMDGNERDDVLIAAAKKHVEFSGEEGDGRFLDLMAFYTEFLNICGPHRRPTEYYEYVRDSVTTFAELPPAARGSKQYITYLHRLLEYLVGFAERAHPLDRIGEHVNKARERHKAEILAQLEDMKNKYERAEDVLNALGADAVKDSLLDLGHKCGGRPIDRAARLLEVAKQGKYKERALTERMIGFILGELLEEERKATVANVQKKLSLTYAEIEEERRADEAMAEGTLDTDGGDGDEELESTIYNPKDVPLGWDGKPIPYWMYKLHGLNHEFKCEICGNATYRGPRAFERHFTETQHVQGLRSLGIGYSKAFMMVTKIADANALNAKLRSAIEEQKFDEDSRMEFEDAEGNVLNKKTYIDLLRQGLL